jgi:MFS family permease
VNEALEPAEQRLRPVLRTASPVLSPDRGLDAVNLLLAGCGSVYGAFIPVYLTEQAWTQAQIGFLLTLNTIASMVFQVPAGLMIDLLGPRRRQVLAVAVIGMGLTPLLLAVAPQPVVALPALVLLAAATSFPTPAVNAISLAVAGRAGFSERLGRNSRYGSIGAGCGALIMGVSISAGLQAGVFLFAVALTVPTPWAIYAIGPDRVHLSRHGIMQPNQAKAADHQGWRRLLRDKHLLIFGACVAMFSVASAGVLQVATVAVNAQLGAQSGLIIAAFLILPQIVVATISPSIARAAEIYGRRGVLLVGFATLPLRGGLFALLRSSYSLVPVQIFEGVGGAIFGVVVSLVSADLTHRTGYYTLCLSMLGLVAGLGTAVSTTLAGLVSDNLGRQAAFWALAACGVLAFVLVALAMPETREPARRRQAGIEVRPAENLPAPR